MRPASPVRAYPGCREPGADNKPLVTGLPCTLSAKGLRWKLSIAILSHRWPSDGPLPKDAGIASMPARDRKASTISPQMDLAELDSQEASEVLAAGRHPDPKSGILRLSDQPCLILRPEVIVSIKKQLEQTVGGSAKGILYLAGERSSDAGLKFLGGLTSGVSAPLTMDGAKRIIDASALTGWGRTES